MNLTAKPSEPNVTPLRRVALVTPNLLSFTRLALGLWFPWVPNEWRIGVVIAGGATDLLDGTLSRAWRATSVTGRIVDPIADKLFVLSVLGTLLVSGEVLAWQASLVAFRDIAVLLGVVGVIFKSGFAAIKEMPPSWLGKCATAAQFAFFVSVLYFERVLVVAFAIAALVSMLAGVDYLRRYLKGVGGAVVLLACSVGSGMLASGEDQPLSAVASHDASRVSATQPINKTDSTSETSVDKSIAFLAREVPGWPMENDCFSCHNNGDGARALYVAARLKRRVPSESLESTTAWLAKPELWDESAGDAVFKNRMLARLQFAVALAAAERAGVIKDAGALRRAAELVASDQDADGSWHVDPPGTVGSPATYGRPLATALAVRTLRVADRGRFQKQVALAEEWLRKLPGQNVLEAAAILTGLEDSDGDDAVAHCDRAIAFLLHAQTSDGGWGPFANSPPENFDTAAALLVLAAFRERDDVRKVVARGRAHLVAEQLADGSWTETTRPPGATSYAQRLSTTAWATLALLATSDGVLLGEW